jgi:tetratricopeptide (TPR) repeat protein
MESEEKSWLVKSGGRILGPMTQAEVLRRLKAREIYLTDDICSPFRRWQNIQHHPFLHEIVEEVRRQLVTEETEVSWSPANITQTATDFLDNELTEELSDKLSHQTKTSEIVIHDLEEEVRPASQMAGAARYQSSAFSHNPALQRKAERTTRWLWMMTGVVLVIAMLLVFQRRTTSREIKQLSAENLKSQIPMLVEAGDYQEALKELKTVFVDPLTSGGLGIFYGPLLIQVDGQTVVGRRVLEQVLADHSSDMKLALTAVGIADLFEGQLAGAQQNFEKALSLDRSFVPALINNGVAYFQLGDYANARSAALTAIRENSAEGEAQLLLGETAIYIHQRNLDATSIDEAISALSVFRSHQMAYEPEMAFYAIYLDWVNGKRKVNEDKVTEFLDLDPQLTEDHRHNVFVYKGRTKWTVMTPFCEQLVKQMGDGPRPATLMAVCYSKAGRKSEARSAIEKAVHQAPRDPLVQAWYANILTDVGMGDQGSVALARANEMNRKGEYDLPVLLQARFCQVSNDNECARQNWQRLFEKNQRSIVALGGLATTYAALGSYVEAAKYIDRGLLVSPDYIPLLKLKLKGQKEGWYGRG